MSASWISVPVAAAWYNFYTMIDERRLWTAVLTQAIRDLIGSDTGTPLYDRSRLRRITRLWFESDNSETGSFRWKCDQLEIDASWLRHGLLESVGTSEKRAANPAAIASVEKVLLSVSAGSYPPPQTDL
jgi:hypothetical protein